MKHFSGRVAFVTGGASGIGYGLVQNFLGLGMKVIVVDFNQEYLQEKRQALAGRDDVHFINADVGDRDQVRAAAAEGVRTVADVRRLHTLLLKKGYRPGDHLLYVEDLRGRHSELAWRRRIRPALYFLIPRTVRAD